MTFKGSRIPGTVLDRLSEHKRYLQLGDSIVASGMGSSLGWLGGFWLDSPARTHSGIGLLRCGLGDGGRAQVCRTRLRSCSESSAKWLVDRAE